MGAICGDSPAFISHESSYGDFLVSFWSQQRRNAIPTCLKICVMKSLTHLRTGPENLITLEKVQARRRVSTQFPVLRICGWTPLPPPPTLRPGHAHDLRIKLPPAVSTCLNPAQGTDWERPGRPIFCAVDAKAECDRTVGVCLTMCMIVRGGPGAARAAPRIATSTNIQGRRFRFAVSYRPDS